MFDPVPPNASLPALERELLEFWKREEIFRRSVEQGEGRPQFTFYEGPPTANGVPHWGHVLTRVAKDVFLRFHTMCGHFVPRRSGWDTHGLPVEIEVEKELGLHGKADVEKIGIERFTRLCIESVFRYIGEWERMSDRVGFWLDRDGYATFHKSFVESVWWALATLFRQGLLYQGYKIVWWWPQGGTALSAGEVGEGYKAVDDPSVVVRFRRRDGKGSLLAWTTTPWTLPSNVALAIHPAETYVEVDHAGEKMILARARVEATFPDGDAQVLRELPGSELVGLEYEPLYRYREPEGGRTWIVVPADFVTLDTGTGIVHVAPAFGEDDFRVAKELDLGFLQLVEPDGRFSADATDFASRFCKEADSDILRDLKERGLLLRRDTYRHDYPFCPRAMDDPLIQYARRSWFIRTSTEKEQVLANNAQIRWQPESIRDGRMGDFLRNNVDWAISRERWWGTPLPVWVNDQTGTMEALTSVAEILERNPDAFRAFHEARAQDPSLPEDLMVHKPWIDEVTFTKPGEPGTYRRVPEVIDCWFDAGSMPFAQWGYPHQGREQFEAAFPADFITEAIDQTRGWWNAMLQISTLLFPERATPHPFRSCVVLGHITDKDGLKLSKRRKNYVPPMETIDHYGADAVRWALLSSSVPGQGTRFHEGVAKDATRDLLLKVWNVYSFFVTYARIDAWDARAARPALASRATLDRWILAELDDTVRAVRKSFAALESQAAARRLQSFVDALSNWYLRRSRARFWASGDSADKHAAFATLHEVLVDLARLLAPFTPFLAETLFQKLARPARSDAPLSVHLDAYPDPSEDRRDDELRHAMGLARDLVALGLQVRAAEKIRVRQPLGEAILVLADGRDVERFQAEITEELNVKSVRVSDEPAKYVEFEMVPNFKALGPKLGKRMPACKQVLQKADGSALHAELESSGKIAVVLPDGEKLELTRDEIEIRLRAREGYAAASHGDQVVVLDTRVTPELRREGLAREVVHHIQAARKALDLPYEARIDVVWSADGEVAQAIERHADYIAGETLATRLDAGEVGADSHAGDVEGEPLRFAIARAG